MKLIYKLSNAGWKTPNSYGGDYAPLPKSPGHEVLRELNDKFGYVRTYFRAISGNLREEKKALIKQFNPPYNVMHRTRGFMEAQ